MATDEDLDDSFEFALLSLKSSYKQKVGLLETEIFGLRDSLKQKEADCDDFQDKLNKLCAEVKELKEHLSSKEELILSQNKEISRLNEENQESKKQVNSLRSDCAKLQAFKKAIMATFAEDDVYSSESITTSYPASPFHSNSTKQNPRSATFRLSPKDSFKSSSFAQRLNDLKQEQEKRVSLEKMKAESSDKFLKSILEEGGKARFGSGEDKELLYPKDKDGFPVLRHTVMHSVHHQSPQAPLYDPTHLIS